MKVMKYADKSCSDTFSGHSFNFNLKKPMLCPHCNAFQDGRKTDQKLFWLNRPHHFGCACYECTYCKEHFVVVYKISPANKTGDCVAIVPTISEKFESPAILKISPRFILLYNQALRAASSGDIELASFGFRQSLESLVKDYAINELQEDKTTVEKLSLFKAIEQYLGEKDLISSADVVRILGNDYVHHEQKYPQYDFDILKKYMEIFIRLIETKLMIAHPPVSR